MNTKTAISFILLLMVTFIVGACSNQESDDSVKENSTLETEIKENIFTEEDINLILTNLKDFTVGTAIDGAEFKIDVDVDCIKVSVIKSITDVMTGYGANTADDTVRAFRNSLTFDTVYDVLKEELDKEIKGFKVYLYNDIEAYTNDDYYTYKNIK